MTPTLILLPGLDGTGNLFEALVSELAGHPPTQIVRYPTIGALGYPAHEAIVRAALPTDRPFILLGESFSGPIALRIGTIAPAGLRGVILCASFARCPRPSIRTLRFLSAWVSPIAVPSWLAAYLVLGGNAPPSLRRSLDLSLRDVSAEMIRARIAAIANVDVTNDARAVQVPCLYLRGTRDRLVPAGCGREVAALVPNCRIVDVDAPHFLLQASPRDASAAIRSFVESIA